MVLKYTAKNDSYYIERSIEEIDRILLYSKGLTIIELHNNQAILDAIIFRMIQMVEQIERISDDFKLVHSEIDWIDIKGFRNRLVHDYGNVDFEFVYNALKYDIPELKEQLIKLLFD